MAEKSERSSPLLAISRRISDINIPEESFSASINSRIVERNHEEKEDNSLSDKIFAIATQDSYELKTSQPSEPKKEKIPSLIQKYKIEGLKKH